MLGYWFLLQLLSAMSTMDSKAGGVAFAAHVGGFLTGIILVKLFCDPQRLAACTAKRGAVSKFVQRVR